MSKFIEVDLLNSRLVERGKRFTKICQKSISFMRLGNCDRVPNETNNENNEKNYIYFVESVDSHKGSLQFLWTPLSQLYL